MDQLETVREKEFREKFRTALRNIYCDQFFDLYVTIRMIKNAEYIAPDSTMMVITGDRPFDLKPIDVCFSMRQIR